MTGVSVKARRETRRSVRLPPLLAGRTPVGAPRWWRQERACVGGRCVENAQYGLLIAALVGQREQRVGDLDCVRAAKLRRRIPYIGVLLWRLPNRIVWWRLPSLVDHLLSNNR